MKCESRRDCQVICIWRDSRIFKDLRRSTCPTCSPCFIYFAINRTLVGHTSPVINNSNEVRSGKWGIWTVREEARQFWDYGTSNEAVYIGKSVTRDSEIASPVPELYLRGNLWLSSDLRAEWGMGACVVSGDQTGINCIEHSLCISIVPINKEADDAKLEASMRRFG